MTVAGFVNREIEIKRLQQAAEHPPELVIVRGRRRVGKSALLDHALAGQRGVYFQADEQPLLAQLALLGQEVARLLPGQPELSLRTWDEAFRLIGELAVEAPMVVVLDEFPALWQSEPSLDSILQRHWDVWERAKTPITMVLSGSALTLMERLMDHSSPLYGRAGYRPLINPLDYRRAAELAAPTLSPAERIMRYAVLGGTPQYQVWAGHGGLSEIIATKILTKDEALYEEPLHLLRSEQQLRDSGTYFAIIAAVAHGDTRTGQISNRTGLPVPNLSKMLTRLVELGYLELWEPVALVREAKRGIYRIRDPYFRFWFRFVFPDRSRLARGRVTEVLAEIERDLSTFVGPIFEDCCREWVGRYASAEVMPPTEELGAWWSRNGQTEVDVVGRNRERFSLVGSCKWSANVPATVLSQLLAHQEALGPKAASARLAIFARGFNSDLVRRADEHGVRLVTVDDLFA